MRYFDEKFHKDHSNSECDLDENDIALSDTCSSVKLLKYNKRLQVIPILIPKT
jgi:hypothetical protein